MINESKETSQLAELIKGHDDLVTLLNNSGENYTLLAPTNKALDWFLHHKHDPSYTKEFLQYHILPRQLDLRDVRYQQTLATLLHQSELGKDMPQRLVVNKDERRVLLNGVSEIIAGNIVSTLKSVLVMSKSLTRYQIGSNGILHQINTPLIPPPNTSTIIKLLPRHFSAFTLGLEKTGLIRHLIDETRAGGTTFAPTNAAFDRLGKRANKYLFSSGGEKCLQALLEYHLVPNRTLYSDVLYDQHGHVHEFKSGEQDFAVHIKLPTLLKNQNLRVDVAWPVYSLVMQVNGIGRVTVHDVLAQDGVVHIVDQVLMPSRKINGKGNEEGIAMSMLRGSMEECKGMPREEL